jgi:hypothetical protein
MMVPLQESTMVEVMAALWVAIAVPMTVVSKETPREQ